MGAHDRVAPDLPSTLGVIVLPLTCGVELRGGGGAPAAQHDAKPSHVPTDELGGHVLGEQIGRILFPRDLYDVQFIVSNIFIYPQELCGDVSLLA